MGYTHYWTPQPLDEEAWNRVAEVARRAIEEAKRDDIKVCYEFDLPSSEPLVSGETIRFNGPGDEGHETFSVERSGGAWDFCKTASKPYDTVVCAVLLALRDEGYTVTSDGDMEPGGEDRNGWANGIALYERAKRLVTA